MHRAQPVSDAARGDVSLLYAADPQDLSKLTTVHESCRFLERSTYEEIVRKTVVCCVDIALRNAEGNYLVLRRGTHPAKGYWWLPGGRLLKGETFFAGAVRKAAQEAGVADATPIKTLGVWNTFFETSAHMDQCAEPALLGTQTVNAIVLLETSMSAAQIAIALDATSEAYKWITAAEAASQPATGDAEDTYVRLGLERAEAAYAAYTATQAARGGENSSATSALLRAAKVGGALLAACAVFSSGFILGAGYVCIAMKKRKDAESAAAADAATQPSV